MLAATATFLLCAAISLGGYWAFVVRPEEAAARALRRRLRAQPVDRPGRSELTKAAATANVLDTLDGILVHAGALAYPIQRAVKLSNLRITVSSVVLACAGVGVIVFLGVGLATLRVWPAIAAGLLMGTVPFMYVRRVARNRISRLEEQFPQAIDLIAVSLRAGHAFPTGLLMVAEELADPLGAEFRLLHDQQNYGKPLPTVLKEFAERVPLLDSRIFVTAVLTQRETGGNLAEILDQLSTLIRERFTIRRQVRVVSAHGRITGWVLACLPPAVALILYLIAPAHVSTLVNDPIGQQLTAGAIVLQLAGMLAIRRIVNIEI